MKCCIEIGNPIVAELNRDEFVVPCLRWHPELEPLKIQSLKGFKAMFTLLQNSEFATVLDSYIPDVEVSRNLTIDHLRNLELLIIRDIDEIVNVILDNNEPIDILTRITHIAVAIQLWGGNTGRNPFVKGAGFNANFSSLSYLQIIKYVIGGDIENAILTWESRNFNHFGVSFASKHISFWSKAKRAKKEYPIFDSLMAQVTLGRNNTNWRQYRLYSIGMDATVICINIPDFTVFHLERQIYNWINELTPAMDWINQRKGE
jgi:hypothetical protein